MVAVRAEIGDRGNVAVIMRMCCSKAGGSWGERGGRAISFHEPTFAFRSEE
jgi:hypothetical protein